MICRRIRTTACRHLRVAGCSVYPHQVVALHLIQHAARCRYQAMTSQRIHSTALPLPAGMTCGHAGATCQHVAAPGHRHFVHVAASKCIRVAASHSVSVSAIHRIPVIVRNDP